MKAIFLGVAILASIQIYAGTEFICTARYLHQVYHPPVPPAYMEGSVIGRQPIAGTGRDGFYEKVWSNTYTLNVKFYSGYELNEYYGTYSFAEGSIIGIVSWDNGGQSVITMEGWVTYLKYITEEEMKYSTDGSRVSGITGYDSEGNYWELYY